MTLEDFGLVVEKPKTQRTILARCPTWEEAFECQKKQREKDPITPVHIEPLADGRRVVYILVEEGV